MSQCFDESDNRFACSNVDSGEIDLKARWLDFGTSESDTDEAKADDEMMLGYGSDEDDSLLVIYQEPSSVY